MGEFNLGKTCCGAKPNPWSWNDEQRPSQYRVIQFDIGADEPERAITFYRGMFGWHIRKVPGPLDYWLVRTGPASQEGINGSIAPQGRMATDHDDCRRGFGGSRRREGG